ncbi:hypothetical protein FF1_016918 [Malus domestica]
MGVAHLGSILYWVGGIWRIMAVVELDGHGVPNDLWHLDSLLLCRFLLSAHPSLIHNPCLSHPRLAGRTAARHTSIVHQRAQHHVVDQVTTGPERGQVVGEVGMRGSDGDVDDAGVGVGDESCVALLLGEGASNMVNATLQPPKSSDIYEKWVIGFRRFGSEDRGEVRIGGWGNG